MPSRTATKPRRPRERAPDRRPTAVRVVLSTAPPGAAGRLARALVDACVAACVQIVPGVRSVYRWKGARRTDRESLLIVKTSREALPRCLRALGAHHPYEVPEAVVLSPSAVGAAYAAWVRAETARQPT